MRKNLCLILGLKSPRAVFGEAFTGKTVLDLDPAGAEGRSVLFLAAIHGQGFGGGFLLGVGKAFPMDGIHANVVVLGLDVDDEPLSFPDIDHALELFVGRLIGPSFSVMRQGDCPEK